MALKMQLATPPPPQPVVAPAAASAGPLLRFEERVNPDFLLAHGGGESHEGLDVPYKLVKYKDNKFLHMSEEERHEWEKKLTGEVYVPYMSSIYPTCPFYMLTHTHTHTHTHTGC